MNVLLANFNSEMADSNYLDNHLFYRSHHLNTKLYICYSPIVYICFSFI